MTVSGGLLERDGVTKAVAGLVEAVRGGQGGALFVVGEAGLGKTSVLDRGCDGWPRRPGWRWGWAGASDGKRGLPFGLADAGAGWARAGAGLLGEDEPGWPGGR